MKHIDRESQLIQIQQNLQSSNIIKYEKTLQTEQKETENC